MLILATTVAAERGVASVSNFVAFVAHASTQTAAALQAKHQRISREWRIQRHQILYQYSGAFAVIESRHRAL